MVNWRKYGSILGVIATLYVVIGHVFNVTGKVIEIIDSSERVKELNAKIHVYDSLHTSYEWRKKRAERFYAKTDSLFELIRTKRFH